MKKRIIFFVSLITTAFFVGCEDCNDCLDTQQKDILVQDPDGNNLLFGDTAIFNPEEVTISSESEAPQPLFLATNTQTLQFTLIEGETTYTLRLDNDNTETIVFELGERESERCCGDQTFSTATLLNGATIANDDLITIVKQP